MNSRTDGNMRAPTCTARALAFLFSVCFSAAASLPSEIKEASLPVLDASPAVFPGSRANIELNWQHLPPLPPSSATKSELLHDVLCIYAPPSRVTTIPLGLIEINDFNRGKGRMNWPVLNIRSEYVFRVVRLQHNFPNESTWFSAAYQDNKFQLGSGKRIVLESKSVPELNLLLAVFRSDALSSDERDVVRTAVHVDEEGRNDETSSGSSVNHGKGSQGTESHTTSLPMTVESALALRKSLWLVLREVFCRQALKEGTFQVLAHSNLVRPADADMPQQGRLALTGRADEMRVMWVSNLAAESTVQFGTHRGFLDRTASGSHSTYNTKDMCGLWATDMFIPVGNIHDVVLTDLTPGQQYFYRFGGSGSWSKEFAFRAPKSVGPNQPTRLLLFGDSGTSECDGMNGWCEPAAAGTYDNIVAELKHTEYDALLHIGDISYAVGHGVRWEQFGHQIEPIATSVPYHVSIGNHEFDYAGQSFLPSWGDYADDSHGECGVPYSKRFHMPGNAESERGIRNLWYSFDVGSTHLILFSTEHNFTASSEQLAWLQRDLAAVDRTRTPWIIVSGHRPMYTSNAFSGDELIAQKLREFVEPLMRKYAVDLALWGHVHAYESTCPVFAGKCVDDMKPPFINPRGTVNAVIGAAGMQLTTNFTFPAPAWSRFRLEEYGYARSFAANSTHFLFEFVANRDQSVHDSFWIVKDRHN